MASSEFLKGLYQRQSKYIYMNLHSVLRNIKKHNQVAYIKAYNVISYRKQSIVLKWLKKEA